MMGIADFTLTSGGVVFKGIARLRRIDQATKIDQTTAPSPQAADDVLR